MKSWRASFPAGNYQLKIHVYDEEDDNIGEVTTFHTVRMFKKKN
jgi:hypothetical protein